MKHLIDQLRSEQERIRVLMSNTENAVRLQKHEGIRSGARTLAATMLARISFHRAAVLPELARQDKKTGSVSGTDRVRLFANELQCIEGPLREMMAPFLVQAPSSRSHLIDAWAVVRDAVESLLVAESSLLDFHSSHVRAERRQSQRLEVDLRATILIPEQIPARVADLSLGGTFLEVPEPLPHVGRLLNLRLFITGIPLPVTAWGEVRRHAHGYREDKSAIGVRFVDLHAQAGLAIATYLSSAALKRSPRPLVTPGAEPVAPAR